MPKKKFNRKTVYAAAAVCCGLSFVTYGYLTDKKAEQADIESIQKLFANKDVPTSKVSGAESDVNRLAQKEKKEANPEFVTAPDYKTATAIAKIYDYALNPKQEEEWLKARMATRAQRQITTRATLAKQEALENLEREKYLQQAEAVRNGHQFASTQEMPGATRHLDANDELQKIEKVIVQLKGYKQGYRGRPSSATLEINGEMYKAVQKGVIVAGMSVTGLDDNSRCVTLVDTNSRPNSNSKVCI